MSNYSKLVNYIVKDSLPSGNPAKIIKGTELDNEFSSIASNMATKLDSSGGTLVSGALSGSSTISGTLTVPAAASFTGTADFRSTSLTSYYNGLAVTPIMQVNHATNKVSVIGEASTGNMLEVARYSDTQVPTIASVRYKGSFAAPTSVGAADNLGRHTFSGNVSGTVTEFGRIDGLVNAINPLAGDVKLSFRNTSGVITDGVAVEGAASASFPNSPWLKSYLPFRIFNTGDLTSFLINHNGTSTGMMNISDNNGTQFSIVNTGDGLDTKNCHLNLGGSANAYTGIGSFTYVFGDGVTNVTGLGMNSSIYIGAGLTQTRNFNSAPYIKQGINLSTLTHYSARNFSQPANETVGTVQTMIGFDSAFASTPGTGGTSSGAALSNISFNSNLAVNGAATITSYSVTANVATVFYTALSTGVAPVVGESVEVNIPELAQTFNGRKTVTAVAADGLSFSYAVTSADVGTTALVRQAGWTSVKNRTVSASSAPMTLNSSVFLDVSTSARNPALYIRNAGLSYSILVDDQSGGDISPFAIDENGNLMHGDRLTRTFVNEQVSITPTIPRAQFSNTSSSGSVISHANYSASQFGTAFINFKTRAATQDAAVTPVAANAVQINDTINNYTHVVDDGVTVGGVETARMQTRVVSKVATGDVRSQTTFYQRRGTGVSATYQGYNPVLDMAEDSVDLLGTATAFRGFNTVGVDLTALTLRTTTNLNFDANPTGFYFSPDGLKVFILGATALTVREHAMTTAWDLTTIVATPTNTFSISAADATPTGVTFNTAGTLMYVTGTTNDSVSVYTLPTAFSLTGATLLNTFAYTTIFANALAIATPNNVTSLSFSPDGLNFYVLDSVADRFFQAKLTVAFDLSTATFFARNPLSIGNLEGNANGFYINADGMSGFLVGLNNDNIVQFSFGIPFDISTVHFLPEGYNVGTNGGEGNSSDIWYNAAYNRIYVLGTQLDDILEYTAPRRTSTFNNDVSVTGRLVVPRMSTAERNALVNVVNGTVIYNTTTNNINYRVNGAWVQPTTTAA